MEDLAVSARAEIENVRNIFQDTSLTSKEKELAVLKEFSRIHDELIEAKLKISELKQQGSIPVILDRSNNK